MSVSDSSPNPDAQRDVEATSPQTARHVAEPTANLKERPAHVSWMDVEGGAGPASAGIGDDAPPPPPAMSSVHIAVQREDDERAGPPPEALSRCRTDADREQLQRYYKHRASIVSLGHIGMPPSLSTGKQPLSEAEGQRAYNELVKSLLLRTMPLIVCGLLLVVAGGLFCAYGEIIQLGVEGNAPIAKVSWLLGAPPVQQFGFGILGVANENQPLYYRLVILAGCVLGGTGVFVLVASISLLVDRLMAGRLLIKKRVQQRVLQRGGGQREEANKEDRQNERTSGEPQPDIQPNSQRDESLPTAAANPDAEATGDGPQSENLPAEHESESAAYMPNTGEPPRVPWNPEDALGEHSRSNSSDNTRVSPVH